jgi:class 3 adenylate cyclase
MVLEGVVTNVAAFGAFVRRGTMTAIRRLAAILAADVAGYSRLIGADEEGTLNRLRSIRADVIDRKITEHRGKTETSSVTA